MKIALLGAAQSGKTVYFSAVYYRFRNFISLPPLTKQKRKEYSSLRIARRMGFGLRISDLDLESKLSENGEKLMQQPIKAEDWPPPSTYLDKAAISIRFDFEPIAESSSAGYSIDDSEEVCRTYHREVEIYDPPGGALIGRHDDSKEITAQLMTCDVAIAFIPADKLFSSDTAESDESEWCGIEHKIAWARMVEIVEDIRAQLPTDDVFPLCFVLSKSDCIPDSMRSLELIDQLFYERLLVQLSRKYPDFLICGCPISVVDPASGNFRATNLEWPFLFAVGGTLMRNYQALKAEAAKSYEAAARLESKAQELEALRRRSKWLRFRRWLADGFETAADNRRAANNYTTAAGRKIRYGQEDHRLATDIWSTIAAEGKELRGMRVLLGGNDISDPRLGVI